MPLLKTQLELLTKQMREQTCYRKYQELLSIIQEDTGLYARLNEYRRRNIELHQGENDLQAEAKLEREYHNLLHDSRIREFLRWEQETLQMVRLIHRQVSEALCLDDSFL